MKMERCIRHVYRCTPAVLICALAPYTDGVDSERETVWLRLNCMNAWTIVVKEK